jgi:N-dimethylarginine dimethylaminohydrolase
MPTPSARILMCPPEYFGIHYEINPWMRRQRPADPAGAEKQWRALHGILEQLGAEVFLLTPQPGLPDLVFTANAAMIHGRRAILSRFRHPERQGEEPINAGWFAEHGFQVERLPEGMYFEGAGDALFCGPTWFAGYRIRSDVRAIQHIAGEIGHRGIPLELVDPYYYHLDTCFCPLADGLAIDYPPAFDGYAQKVLRDAIPELIEVRPDEARALACNAVVVGTTVVTNVGCPVLHRRLKSLGFDPIETPLGEFVKAGGSAKCLTLRLDGEEAAPFTGAS